MQRKTFTQFFHWTLVDISQNSLVRKNPFEKVDMYQPERKTCFSKGDVITPPVRIKD